VLSFVESSHHSSAVVKRVWQAQQAVLFWKPKGGSMSAKVAKGVGCGTLPTEGGVCTPSPEFFSFLKLKIASFASF